MSKKFWSIIMIILLASSPLSIVFALEESNSMRMEEKAGFKVIYNGVLNIAVPSNGTKPMFFWWSDENNSTIYHMKYEGMAESWLTGQFKHILMLDDSKNYTEQILKLFENTSLIENSQDKVIKNLGDLNNKIKDLSKEMRKSDLDLVSQIIGNLSKEVSLWQDSEVKYELLNDLKTLENKIIEFKNAISNVRPNNMAELRKIMMQIMNFSGNITKKANEQILKTKIFKIKGFKPNHPFYFPFSKGVWVLEDPINITNNGDLIGVAFTWRLDKVPDKKWVFLEDNLEIRNRLYFKTVEENVNGTTMNLTRAELKSDIILRRWDWNYETLLGILNENTQYVKTDMSSIFSPKPFLSINIHFTAINRGVKLLETLRTVSESEEVEETEELEIFTGGDGLKIKLGDKREDLDLELRNMPIRGVAKSLPGLILGKNETVGGFFRFLPNATITYPNGTSQIVSVRGYFWPAGRQVRASLLYPYFGNATLEHDPSVGVVATQIKPETIVAKVNISGSKIEVKPVDLVISPLVVPTLVPYTVLGGLAFVTIICVIVISISKKKKMEVIS
ncbi:MAG: hypothetical protein QXJ17_02930 [Nitrososphaeria archaeon]